MSGINCAVGDLCVKGQCQYTCAPGFKDLDGDPTNRCEYACPVFPIKTETCNGQDDDCDGAIDDNPSGVGGSCTDDCPATDPCVKAGSCAPYKIAPNTNGCYGACSAPGTRSRASPTPRS